MKVYIPIVLVGVVGVDQILDIERYGKDEGNLKGYFCSRFAEFRLTGWNDPHAPIYATLLKTIYDDCDFPNTLEQTPFYMDDGIREWMIKVTGGLTGKIITLIKWAAESLFEISYQK